MCQQRLIVATTKSLDTAPLGIKAKTVGIDDEMIAGQFWQDSKPMINTSHDTGIDDVGRYVFVIGKFGDGAGSENPGWARGGPVADALVERPVGRLAAARAIGCGFAANALVWREGL